MRRKQTVAETVMTHAREAVYANGALHVHFDDGSTVALGALPEPADARDAVWVNAIKQVQVPLRGDL